MSRDSMVVIFTCFEFEVRTIQTVTDTFPLNLGHPSKEGYCSQMPRSLTETIPQKTRGKTKGNRSIRCIPGGNEAIWDEELHAALIEGICF
jgi:hypothetical protein